MAIYLVGDIQGCFDELSLLLDKVNFDPTNDQLWPVGDLIGRGPKSLETLTFIYQNQHAIRTVLGNHDLHFLAVYFGIKENKPKDKFEQLLADDNCEQYATWLAKQPLARLLPNGDFVSHAGLYPIWSVEQAISLSNEIASQIADGNLIAILNNMYSDQPSMWSDNHVGVARQRFIINAFTRMRYLTDDCELDLKSKMPVADAPSHLIPWFLAKKQHKEEKVYFGHWASIQGITDNPTYIALDTGCVWGGALTMMRYDDGQYFSQASVQKFKI